MEGEGRRGGAERGWERHDWIEGEGTRGGARDGEGYMHGGRWREG